MAIYPDVVKQLLNACANYESRKMNLEEFQVELWRGAQQIVAYEERDLRALLKHSEGELERIRFTVNADEIYTTSLPVVRLVEASLRNNLDA